MSRLDLSSFQRYLSDFRLTALFVDVLGWNRPPGAERDWAEDAAGDTAFARRAVAELGGVVVLQVVVREGWPDEAMRMRIWKRIAQRHAENLLIFTDRRDAPAQSLWYWVKRIRDEADKTRLVPRRHEYFRGQPVDLFASKLQAMVVELSDLDTHGRLPVLEAARRIQSALDVEQTTKRFYSEYKSQHEGLLAAIEGIDDERDRRWYASVVLNRLMFVWFMQKKGFLNDCDFDYLPKKLAESKRRGHDRFFGEFLKALFFDAFAKSEDKRSAETRQLTGRIPYLNGGLFLHHKLELDEHHAPRLGKTLRIPDTAFEGVFKVFSSFTWHLDDTPRGQADEINPDVLGYIFEKYINQKAFGAYYTPPEITNYLAERSIHRLILERMREPAVPELKIAAVEFDSVADLLAKMDAHTALRLVKQVLPSISVLDPAVGSGAFLVAALKCLVNVYSAVVGRAKLEASRELKDWLAGIERVHPSVGYWIKRRIVTDNLYGVDLMEEACEIAKLRLFLAMVSSVREVQDLEPLPNIDFNILPGNSLVGLMRVDADLFDAKYRHGDLFRKGYAQLLDEKRRALDAYRYAADALGPGTDLRVLRDEIDTAMAEAGAAMNEIVQDQFAKRGIQFEQATWDAVKSDLGKAKKRTVTLADVAALHPLHWGYVFDEIVQQRGGFDIVLTNPPWEVFKPQAKEFFADHSELVTKNRMSVEEFEDERVRLTRNKAIREAWLAYESRFPHVNKFFRSAPEYQNQFAVVNGRKVGSDLNLYKLFTERCHALLRAGGQCGIVIPGGIYTDLGAKGLRELLFTQTRIQGLFGFENRREIFEGVDSRFKFVVLTFEKSETPRLQQPGERNASAPPDDLLAPTRTGALSTQKFPAAFMRLDVADLDRFPDEGALWFDVQTIRTLAPDSLAIMEFDNAMDVAVISKVHRHPSLGSDAWGLVLRRELHMTGDKDLFKQEPGNGRAPLVEGKQFHQYDANFAAPRRWVDVKETKQVLRERRAHNIARQFSALGIAREPDPKKIALDCDSYRLAFRDVARNTDERTVIACILPPLRFCPHTVSMELVYQDRVDERSNEAVATRDCRERLYLLGFFDSFVFDWILRKNVTAHVSFYLVYNAPVPRLQAIDARHKAIVSRAARLTCTTAEYDALARNVGLRDHRDGATDAAERARLRAEIDGLVAQLYGLTDAEFQHILAAFPLVPEPEKVAAYNAFRDVTRGLIH